MSNAASSLIPTAPPSMLALVEKPKRRPLYACCDKAVEVFCTCLCSTTCEAHGSKCTGSHS